MLLLGDLISAGRWGAAFEKKICLTPLWVCVVWADGHRSTSWLEPHIDVMTLVAEWSSLMWWVITAEAGAFPRRPVSSHGSVHELQRVVVQHEVWLRHLHLLYHNHVNRNTARSSLVTCLAINTHLWNELSWPPSHNYTAPFTKRNSFPQSGGRCHID